MAPRTITLDEPIESFGQRITKITLKEPKFGQLTRIPNPVSVMRFANGAESFYIAPDVIREWVEALGDIDPLALEDLSASDTFKVQDAILSFFNRAQPATTSSPPRAPAPDSSSSGSDSIQVQ